MKPCEIGTIESTDSTEIDVEEEEISNSIMLDEMLENIAISCFNQACLI